MGMGGTSNDQRLLLGAATGYGLEDLLPFVVSLKKTGYRGRLCLFVWDLDSQTLKTLDALGVELYPCSSDRVDKQYTVTGGRFLIFRDFLRDIASDHIQVMISDVRDVVFQRDPFEGLHDKGMNFFLEQAGYTLDTETFNAGALSQAYGQDIVTSMAGKPISCVGVTMGDVISMRSYLLNMAQELESMDKDFFGSDQAAHNRIVHSGTTDFKYRMYGNDTKQVMHMGLVPAEAILWSDNSIVNKDGEVVAVLHQYDRHQAVMDRLLRKIL
jgi:hypothetical protein